MSTPRMAYCGLQCEECPVFAATVNNDDSLRKKTAKEWTKLFADYVDQKELLPTDMNCHGCQAETDCHFIGCMNCPIRKCSKGRNLETCADCSEYASCEMINGFFTMHQEAKQNLDNKRRNRDT